MQDNEMIYKEYHGVRFCEKIGEILVADGTIKSIFDIYENIKHIVVNEFCETKQFSNFELEFERFESWKRMSNWKNMINLPESIKKNLFIILMIFREMEEERGDTNGIRKSN